MTSYYARVPSSRKQTLTLVATIVASAMTFIDTTVVNVALPALQKELGATINLNVVRQVSSGGNVDQY